MNQPHPSSPLLGMRYRILRELGRGGFGRTYLAEDLNRFQEPCVLKEFLPQVTGNQALQKATELFEREAGVLYKLQHPQIPKFRELLRVGTGTEAQLFLVQDYVDGSTYRELLEARKQEGRCFSEAEVIDLLRQLLPVIEYIHRVGVIHRDIAPDNLILRQSDRLPVLIDFGGVKQIAATVEEQLTASNGSQTVTRVGKIGYAPDEQMQAGIVSPSADLYALGVTILVLLTGKEPATLFDAHTMTWHWRREVQLSPNLGRVLDKLLAYRPSDRYPDAAAVIQALDLPPVAPVPPPSAKPAPPRPPATPTTEATVAVGRRFKPKAKAPAPLPPLRSPAPAPLAAPASTPSSALKPSKRSKSPEFWRTFIVLILLVTGAIASVGLVWWVATQWEPSGRGASPVVTPADEPPSEPEPSLPSLSAQERSQNTALYERQARLGIDRDFFISLVNRQFYVRYPEQRGKTLSTNATDAPWRQRWRDVGQDLLDILDQDLSKSARQKLGQYAAADLARLQAEALKIHVGSRALNNVTDARFFQLFPEQRDQDFISQPIGQVWYAIAAEQLDNLKAGEGIEEIELGERDRESVSRELDPGEAKVYLLDLKENQTLQLELDAPEAATQLSVYLPQPTAEQPFLLANSTDTEWSGELPQSGYYEVVVTAQSDEAFDYELILETDQNEADANSDSAN